MVPWFYRYRILLWLLPAFLIWLALRNVSFNEVANTLTSLEPWQLLSLVVINAGIFLLFTSRWWLILRIQGSRVPYLQLIAYRLAGFSLTYLTPGPQVGGEPLQVHLVRSRHAVPASTSIAAVTLDKLLELQSNFAFLVLGVTILLQDRLFGDHFGLVAMLPVLGLLALPAGYLLLLGTNRQPVSSLAGRISHLQPGRLWISRLRNEAFSAETQVSRFLRERPMALLSALGLSLWIWLAMLLEFYLMLRFLGVQLDLFGVIVLLTSARIAFLLPLPAGAGSLEAALVLTAGFLGISSAQAVGLTLLIRLRDISLACLGLVLAAALTRSRPVVPLPTQGSD